jgi:hypothetical protein
MAGLSEVILEFTTNSRNLGLDLLVAIFIIVIGILIGKFVKLILNRVVLKLKLDKIFKFGTVDIGLTIVKWAIYLFFIGFAVERLSLPYLSTSFTNAISIIPKSIGALIVIVAGFILGKFFQNTIDQTGKKDFEPLGYMSFYLFIYISFILSIHLIFVASQFLVNWTSLIFTSFFLLFLTLKHK